MAKKGWHVNLTQHPVAIHFCVTPNNARTVKAHFLADLRSALKSAPPHIDEHMTKAVYGMMEEVPDTEAVQEMLG